MAKPTLRQIAREIAALAHAKALHAMHPILCFGSPQQREIVYRTMAIEFDGLNVTVEDLLARSEAVQSRSRRRGVAARTTSA